MFFLLSTFLGIFQFSPESPLHEVGDVVVAEVDLHQDLEVVESALVDCLSNRISIKIIDMVGIDSITSFIVFMKKKKNTIGHHLSHCKEADLDPTVTEGDLLEVRQLCDENIFTQARDLQQGRVHDSLSYKTVHHLLSVHRHRHVVSVECPSIVHHCV